MAAGKLLVLSLLLAAVACPSSSSSDSRLKCPEEAWAQQQPASRVATKRQLYLVRSEMARSRTTRVQPLDAFILGTHDEHQSEDVAERDQRLKFVSGFSGSSGCAAVTQQQAALWTDGRYFLQADEQLDCQWRLMRSGMPRVLNVTSWLAEVLKPGAKVGADPRMVPYTTWALWSQDLGWLKHLENLEIKEISAGANISLIGVGSNPVDQIWTSDRPNYASQPVFVHDIKYAGKSWQDKISELRSGLRQRGADAMVVTALDEVSWLLNLRARDLPHTPVVRAYLLVSSVSMHLYTNKSKVPSDVRAHLASQHCHNENCVRLKHYENISADLSTLSQSWNKVLIPSPGLSHEGASQYIYSAVRAEKKLLLESPVVYMKAVKNPTERAGMRRAHVRDAAALCDFLALLEREMSRGKPWTELDVATSVDKFRLQQDLARGLSFATIAGYGGHAALPHYQPTAVSSQPVGTSSTLVIDSGGQYFDGTTDVTRTLHYGTPSDFHREVYTRVLKGSIQLSRAVFPGFLSSGSVDIMARAPLWQLGLDYHHGTGHGIGHFLSVHEHPVDVMYSNTYECFQDGYFFSNEPGYYEEGNFGVRLENILEVVNQTTLRSTQEPYLGFQTITLVPYEPKLIDTAMLSNDEIRWLNAYNLRIISEVGRELKRQRRMSGFSWLLKKTTYIPEHSTRASGTSRHATAHLLLLVASLSSCWLLPHKQWTAM